MLVRILTVKFDSRNEIFEESDFQNFLLNKHVHALHPQFFMHDGQAYWSVFLTYEEILPRNAPGEKLCDAERALMNRLREWRKDKADREGVPVFIIATNQHLLDIVRLVPKTLEGLRQVHGFGRKRSERHGQEIVGIVKAFQGEVPETHSSDVTIEINTGVVS